MLVAPVGVETRQSTKLLAVTDKDVYAAFAYIRGHFHTRVTVEDILDVVPEGCRQGRKSNRGNIRLLGLAKTGGGEIADCRKRMGVAGPFRGRSPQSGACRKNI